MAIYTSRARKKRGESLAADQAVQRLLSSLKFDPSLFAVFDIWDKESRGYVKNCEAVAIHGSRLCVRVPSASHRHELHYIKDRILAKVNQALGRRVITDIQFEFQ